MLEEKLDQIDESESNPLYLGANRLDDNPERLHALRELDRSLEAYGTSALICSRSRASLWPNKVG